MIDIDFGNGKIEYNEFHIDINKPLKDQIWELKEDLLQVKYFNKDGNIFTVDVGWFPEFDLNGVLKIVLVKNFDWENPVLTKKSSISQFYNSLNEFVQYASNL